MKSTTIYRVSYLMGALKIFIAGFMMLAGILTPFKTPEHISGALGIVYNNHLALSVFGIVFFVSGAVLMYGKIGRHSKMTGIGLLMVFACFLFASILETVARHTPSIGNIAATLIVATLYLWWRFKTAYFNPKQLNTLLKDDDA